MRGGLPWGGQRFAGNVAALGVAGWWLSGGIAPSACVAAYQPKGAASLAASYTNRANPGTYNAAPGTAPSFAAATGWTFSSGSSQYLVTGVTPANDQSWSWIVRWTTAGATACLFGVRDALGTASFQFYPQVYGSMIYSNAGAYTQGSVTRTSGVNAAAGNTAYNNGVSEGTLTTVGGAVWGDIYLGARNLTGTGAEQFASGTIAALAIYNVTITAAQVAALTTAMNAL